MNVKKIVFTSLFFFTLLFPLVHPFSLADAETWDPHDPQYKEANDEAISNASLSLPTSITNSNAINLADWTCMLIGGNACSKQFASKYSNFGLVPQIEQVNLAMMTNQPADLQMWIADTGHSLGFLPQKTYAQGVGFTGLSPLLGIWKAFRNIAYILLSLAMVVVAFMIMFRRKIDPQTTVSIQQALPRIILTLILITFSYAIAGLLIDLLYVVLLAAYSVFLSAGLPLTRDSSFLGVHQATINTQVAFTSGSLTTAVGTIFPGLFSDFGTLIYKITGYPLDQIVGAIGTVPGAIAGTVATAWAGPFAILGGFVGAAGGYIVGGLLVQLLIGILLAVLVIRLFFLFVGAYIQIVLYVLFGPLMILPEIFPGSNAFSGWIKNIIGNLSIFAVSGIAFMLATLFVINAEKSGQQIWSPPYLMLINPTSDGLSALFTLGILMLTPTLASQAKQLIIGKGSEVPIGGALVGGFMPAVGTVFRGVSLYTQWQTSQRVKDMASAAREQASNASGGAKPPPAGGANKGQPEQH